MTPRVVAIWLASFTPTPPNDAWRSSSTSIGGAFRPSPSSSFRHPVRYYSPSPPRRRGLVRRLTARSSRGGRHNIHVAHDLSTTTNDDFHDDDEGGGKGGGCISFFFGDANIAIERVALDDVEGLERMSEFCVSGFYDDDCDDEDDDDAGDGTTLSR